MAVVFALEQLYDDVEALFAAEAAAEDPPIEPVPMVFGWREPARRGTSYRIVWVPGDDRSGELGELGPAKQPGRNPRPLWTLDEQFTVYLEAYDPTDAENERAQYHAARLLFDAWARAIYRVARGTVRVAKPTWVTDKKVRRHGATLRVLASIDAMVPDTAYPLAPSDTEAHVTSYPSATSSLEPELDVVEAVP